MRAFWKSLFLIAVAEMGDKSQLVALAFATRFSAMIVLAGVTAATLLVHLASVALGSVLDTLIPETWLNIGAGVAFIAFGLWTLRGDKLEDEFPGRSG